jgi:putative membrane protein
VAAGIIANVGKIIDMYLEGVKDPRTYASPFFLFAAGLIVWSSSIFILASSSFIKFDITPIRSIQYLAVSAMMAVLIALTGIKLKNYIAKTNPSNQAVEKETKKTARLYQP